MNRKMFRAMKRNPKLQEEVYLIDGQKMPRAYAIEHYEACIKCMPKQTASDSIENARHDYIKRIKCELCRLYEDAGLTNPYAKFRNFDSSQLLSEEKACGTEI